MEVDEVELKKTDDVMFKRIGVDVSMLLDGQGFASDQLPARALAVSNRFGYCLYAHSRGFSVARTADLIEIAENLKDKRKAPQTAQAKSIANIPGDNIRSLSLSSDELTVAVCFGESVKFYDLPALVRKSGTCPFEVRRVDPVADAHAKEFSWSPTDTDAYLIVTNNQKLLLGRIGFASEVKVEKGVLTASWSEDGKHVAYVSENRQLSITTSTFAKSFDLELPAHLSEEDVESDLTVDAIRWVRPDSIMVGYVRVNSEGEEDGYPLFMVTSTSGNLAEKQSRSRGLLFYQLFPSIDSFVAPSGSGPYMLVDYLKPWEIVVTASRKSIDDHIVLLGWLPENGKDEAYSLELGNDLWLPRIELQENGDDNALVGLAIDRTTVQIQLTDPKDDAGESKLPPCPVLICATLEGKLSFFSFARDDEKRRVPNLVSAPLDIPESKRSTTQSSQASGKASSATGVPASKPLDDSERRSVAKQADLQEKEVEEISSQPAGLSSKSKEDAKDSTASVQEGIRRPSPSLQSGLLQKAEGPKLGLQSDPSQSSPFTKTEGPKLGFIPGSQDSKQSSLNANSALALRDKGVENMNNPYQGMFRPFEDGPRGGSVSTNTNFPPSFSFNVSTRASSLTKTVPLPNPAMTVSSSPLGTSSQATGVFHKGDENVSATRPVSAQPERASQVPATTAFSLTSALPGKGFQAGAAGFPHGGAAFSGKVNDTGLMTRPPGMSSQGMKGSQVSNSSQRVAFTQRVDKVNPGLQSWSGQEQQSQGRATGVSDMEAAFITELEKVRRMAEEVDQLIYSIERRVTKNDRESNSTFTRRSLEELEQGIHDLSEDCKSHRRQLTQEKQNVEDLRDESLRVDAWRIYARSLMEQRNDSRHQELWTLQKLHPELDMKRKRVLKADQDLKMKIAEMEKHLQSLELQEWQADYARRRPNKQVRSPGQFLSVQNVYNTVNVQMAAAEELSISLAQQMEALNIDWSSPSSKSSAAAVILKSVGAQPKDVTNSYVESNGQSPISRQRLSYSPLPKEAASVNRITTPGGQVRDLCGNLQETTRRRRDSMDATWVESGAPKTTIKRPVHNKPNQGFASGNSSFPTFMQGKGTVPDVSARDSWSQSRHVRQTQSMRMATQSTNVNFSSPRFEAAVSAPLSGRTATSGPQGPFAQQDQQKRSSFTPQNGDPSAAHSTLFGSSSLVGSVDSKQSISKWANPATGSQITLVAPTYLLVPFGKQGTVGASGDPSFSLSVKTSSTTTSRQSSAGSLDWTAERIGGNFPSVPATKPRLEGAFDEGAGDMMGRTVGPVKGIMLGNKFGTVSSTDNQMDGSRLDKETNQNTKGISSGGSASLVTGPHSLLTGPEPTFPSLFPTGSTSGSGGTASHSQLLRLAERSSGSKQQESDGRADRGNESQASLKQSSVADFPAQPRPSTSEIQSSGVRPSTQKEPANRSEDIKVATNSRNATFGGGAKSFFDFSSKSGSFLSPATQSSTPGFTSVPALASGASSQVSKSLFNTETNDPVEPSSGIMSSTSPSVSKLSGSASPVSTIGPEAISQSASSSSSAVDKSDLKTLTANTAPPFSSPAVTAAPKLGIQGKTSTTPNMFLVPSANTRLMSGNAGASAGGQVSTISSISSDLGKSFLTSASSTSAPIQSDGSFTSSSVPTTAQSALSSFTLTSVSPPSQTTTSPFASSSISGFSSAGIPMASSPFGQSGTWPSSGQLPFMFPNSSSMASTASVTPSAVDNNEDDMEEEAITAASTATLGGFGGFGGLGLGSSNTPAQTQKTNPFGGLSFGSSPAPTLSAPSGGQLFRPAAFSLPATQSSSPQQSGGGPFGSSFGSSGFSQNNLFSPSDAGKPFGGPSQSSPGGFGQPAQLGPGQQALGSALGAFGQTRRMGFGTPSITGASGGFAAAPQGGGFANAATGGGFSSAATGGGFASAATGGGFAGAATGGGFAAAVSSGGFAGAATGGGFADLGAGGFRNSSGGGFQAFGGTQASQPFGGGIQASLFTQMRK